MTPEERLTAFLQLCRSARRIKEAALRQMRQACLLDEDSGLDEPFQQFQQFLPERARHVVRILDFLGAFLWEQVAPQSSPLLGGVGGGFPLRRNALHIHRNPPYLAWVNVSFVGAPLESDE